VRVDALAQGRHLHARAAPFVRADQAQQLAQGGDERFFATAIGFIAGQFHVRRAAQRNV
jgi:hypothetical protein